MKRTISVAFFACLTLGLNVALVRIPVVEASNGQKVVKAVRTVDAADLADAFARDAKKASRDFNPKTDGPLLQVTGIVTRVIKDQAVVNNVNSKVRVYVS